MTALNNNLVTKEKTIRKKKTNKHFGEARELTVEDYLLKIQGREKKEALELSMKERRLALRGKGVLAKLVWKEMPVPFDYFE